MCVCLGSNFAKTVEIASKCLITKGKRVAKFKIKFCHFLDSSRKVLFLKRKIFGKWQNLKSEFCHFGVKFCQMAKTEVLYR